MDGADIAGASEALFRDASLKAQLDKGDEVKRPVDDSGVCIDCDVDIDPIRLQAVQTARCIDCQEVHEAMEARYAR